MYERLLVHNQFTPHRWRITLEEILTAGESEPRVLELLPGLLRHRPTVICRWRRDVAQHRSLQQVLDGLDTWPPERQWRRLPVHDLRRAAARVAARYQQRRRTQHWRTLNIRVTEDDLARLARIAARERLSKSETLRRLLRQTDPHHPR
ncbi:MAG: ribbon-helix-helix protein, CopG family [Deltaproteobacteria bacterium]|nr:ribbon-helix-helix protein, CopG family [Deltaproteobacteria bacterium]